MGAPWADASRTPKAKRTIAARSTAPLRRKPAPAAAETRAFYPRACGPRAAKTEKTAAGSGPGTRGSLPGPGVSSPRGLPLPSGRTDGSKSRARARGAHAQLARDRPATRGVGRRACRPAMLREKLRADTELRHELPSVGSA